MLASYGFFLSELIQQQISQPICILVHSAPNIADSQECQLWVNRVRVVWGKIKKRSLVLSRHASFNFFDKLRLRIDQCTRWLCNCTRASYIVEFHIHMNASLYYSSTVLLSKQYPCSLQLSEFHVLKNFKPNSNTRQSVFQDHMRITLSFGNNSTRSSDDIDVCDQMTQPLAVAVLIAVFNMRMNRTDIFSF